MTPDQWATATDPMPLLEFLLESGRTRDRKLRLFAAACCRMTWPLLGRGSRRAVAIAELFADGQVGNFERDAAADLAGGDAQTKGGSRTATAIASAYAVNCGNGWDAAVSVAGNSSRSEEEAGLLRDIFGNPFRPVPQMPSLLKNDAIRQAAFAAYDHRLLPQGHLDPQRLAVLAEEVERAGGGEELVAHLREPGAVHVRGCFAIDMLLAKA